MYTDRLANFVENESNVFDFNRFIMLFFPRPFIIRRCSCSVEYFPFLLEFIIQKSQNKLASLLKRTDVKYMQIEVYTAHTLTHSLTYENGSSLNRSIYDLQQSRQLICDSCSMREHAITQTHSWF